MHIPFNKPYISTNEAIHVASAITNGHLSGNGEFTQKCQSFFEKRYGFKKSLLTHSCTAALEMSAILIDIKPGDEVIMPSYTFVSTANAFALRGAKIIFADCKSENPNIDAEQIENLISPKTKAIVIVHYAGIACDMDSIMKIVKKYNLFLIEDAAHAIEAKYKNRYLGTFGDFATFSFHETKNITSGEGGLLAINNDKFVRRSEIIWEKGTNRAAFKRGEVKKYEWVDIGSSFLPSEIIASFLFGQLQTIENIQKKRLELYEYYFLKLEPLAKKFSFELPYIPSYATANAHIFYLILDSKQKRNNLIKFLLEKDIHALFHYICLHNSPYYKKINTEKTNTLDNSMRYQDCLVRLPMFYNLSFYEIDFIVENIELFFASTNS